MKTCRNCAAAIAHNNLHGYCRQCKFRHRCKICGRYRRSIGPVAPRCGSCMVAMGRGNRVDRRICQGCTVPHPEVPMRIMRLADLAAQGLPLRL
jgi:hypothetical protein